MFDVVIVGGGPGGLSAAQALGRARKKVLVCDGGPRRNAAAVHLHNFVTRDGTPPEEFRRLGREDLRTYPGVEVRDVRVDAIEGARGAFEVRLGGETVRARRILLATGMIDEMLPIPGFRELWGRSIFQCPYCHGWEEKDRRWGFFARAADAAHVVPFALVIRGWTPTVTAFLPDDLVLPDEGLAQLHAAKIRVARGAVTELVARDGALAEVALADGTRVPCEALFAHPPQRQVDLVRALGLALDEAGYVVVDPMRRETSVPGIYAGGDLTSRMQGAIPAAAMALQAAAMLNAELTAELATSGLV